jgi:hypothetical protein
VAAWRAAADHPVDRAVLASLSCFRQRPRALAGSFCCLEPLCPANHKWRITLPPVWRMIAADSANQLDRFTG